METEVIDFVPWGLDATWPSRRWIELVDGRRDGPPKGARLGHASESALVLVCTYPRPRFDAEMPGTGADLVRELAFESTFALINFALHQIKGGERRPEGLVGSLVSYANQQADRYPDWGTAYWGIGPGGSAGHDGDGAAGRGGQAGRHGFGLPQQAGSGLRGSLRLDMAEARTTALAGWQSGFSIGDPDSYIVVHACGVDLDRLQLTRVNDPAGYGLTVGPPALGEMHWELWPSQQEMRYDDLARLVAG